VNQLPNKQKLQNLPSLPQLSFYIVTILQLFRHITPQWSLSVTLPQIILKDDDDNHGREQAKTASGAEQMRLCFPKSKQGECTPKIIKHAVSVLPI